MGRPYLSFHPPFDFVYSLDIKLNNRETIRYQENTQKHTYVHDMCMPLFASMSVHQDHVQGYV